MCDIRVVRRIAAPIVAVSLALTAALLAAAPAGAYEPGCGGVHIVPARRHLNPGRLDPLMIGDSVLLGAMPQVSAAGFDIDTRGCRGWDEGRHVIAVAKARHRLPHLVVMQLGTNWSISVGQIRSVLRLIGRERVLAVLTPRESGGYAGSDAAHVRAAGRRWPRQVVVLDWVRVTRRHPSWFQPDGIHLMPPGARGLARLLGRAARYAAPGAFPQA